MSIADAKQSQRFIGFNQEERPTGDFYPSPPMAVEALLDRVPFTNTVWEPACGDGTVSEVLKKRGYQVFSSDLYDWGYGDQHGLDFLKINPTDHHGIGAIITNPPFNVPPGASHDFAVKALAVTKETGGKVAFLQRLQWLESKSRKHLFVDEPFAKLLVFSARLPRMHRYDHTGTKSSSMMAFGWFVWDWKHVGPPTMEWI